MLTNWACSEQAQAALDSSSVRVWVTPDFGFLSYIFSKVRPGYMVLGYMVNFTCGEATQVKR